ncbi:hypothetical protein HU200_033528 [Digitaria exilis]|uniref:Uncharacterized protein n=1 Tax=Digitaria exilis TaxID=1010633 RepID=A0A835BKX8_9POAL|nr:hypothetical protein HU200_033528 [Digitaria exilis]
MLELYTSWTSPSCASTPTLLPRPPRIQLTPLDGFGNISHIRCQNKAYKDALERGRRRCHFGSGPSPEHSWIILCDNESCCVTCFGPTGSCIMSGFGPS